MKINNLTPNCKLPDTMVTWLEKMGVALSITKTLTVTVSQGGIKTGSVIGMQCLGAQSAAIQVSYWNGEIGLQAFLSLNPPDTEELGRVYDYITEYGIVGGQGSSQEVKSTAPAPKPSAPTSPAKPEVDSARKGNSKSEQKPITAFQFWADATRLSQLRELLEQQGEISVEVPVEDLRVAVRAVAESAFGSDVFSERQRRNLLSQLVLMGVAVGVGKSNKDWRTHYQIFGPQGAATNYKQRKMKKGVSQDAVHDTPTSATSASSQPSPNLTGLNQKVQATVQRYLTLNEEYDSKLSESTKLAEESRRITSLIDDNSRKLLALRKELETPEMQQLAALLSTLASGDGSEA